MQQISPIKQRILNYIDLKGISKYKFYQSTGITRGVLDKESGISEENIAKFIAYDNNVNLEWLLLGKGNIYKTKNIEVTNDSDVSKNVSENPLKQNIKNKLTNDLYTNDLKAVIQEQRNIITDLKEQINLLKENLIEQSEKNKFNQNKEIDVSKNQLGLIENKIDELASYIQLKDKLSIIKTPEKKNQE